MKIILLLVVMSLMLGCEDAEEKQWQLFYEGKYEELIAKYPYTRAAGKARDKLHSHNDQYYDSLKETEADSLYSEGKYETILISYPKTKLADSVRTNFPEVEEELEREKRVKSMLAEQEKKIKQGECLRNLSNCLKIGMREWDVTPLIGYPNRKNTTDGVYKHSQWVYEIGYTGHIYLYFDDGELTSWQY